MYKKLTCAFCLVTSIFIVAVVIYLLLSNAVFLSDEPPVIKVPKVSLYLVNETGREKLLFRKPNWEYVLSEGQIGPDVGKDPAESNNLESRKPVVLRIRCHSNYPVQLNYIGFGNVTEAKNYNRRQIQDFEDRASYVFTTELEFSNVDEGITGKYDCQVRDEQNQTVANTFIFIYAAGPSTFVSHSTRELISKPGSVIQVPCPVSHPNKRISLIQLIENTTTTTVEKEVEDFSDYDPRRGFTLPPDSTGSFYCRDKETLEDSGRVTVFLPLSKVVKGRSLRIYSQNVDNRHETLKLGCRAKEPVELKFYNFLKFSKEPRQSKNESLEFPFALRIKINKNWFGGNVSVVNCVTKRDRRVIRTWKFLKEELPDETYQPQVILQQPVRQPGYQCCSSSKSSTLPTLRTYPCQTPTECELRKPCLSIDPLRTSPTQESCPLLKDANEAIYQNGENCTLLRVEGNSSGIIRCLLDSAILDYAYFTGTNMDGMYSTLTSLSKSKFEPGAVLKMKKINRSSNLVGQKGSLLRFECQGSKLLFASGFQWGIEKVDEPIKYLTNKGVRVESDPVLHNEWIDISFTDSTNRRFYCFAPLITPPLYGQQWVNVSITF